MSLKSAIERIDKAWETHGVLLWALRHILNFGRPLMPNAKLKQVVLRYVQHDVPGEAVPKSRKWVSEFWVLFCLILAISALASTRPLAGSSFTVSNIALWVLCVLWPLLRLLDISHFVLDWVFVAEAPLHSTSRSLLSFLINLLEVAALLVAVDTALSHVAPADRTAAMYQALVAMITIAQPSAGQPFAHMWVEQFRFWFGLLLMLCVVGSLAGGVLRRSLSVR
jgi:hypothetical protein